MLVLVTLENEYGGVPDKEALERLLTAVAGGDREAFGRLYSRTRPAVYGLVLSYLKHADDAQDVTQDAFVRIWDSAPQYRPQGKPMAWMLTVARNLALMRLRERGKSQTLEEGEWSAIPASAPAVTPEDREVLQNALARLSGQERRVVILHAVAGLKHREIASVLQVPLATVLSQYHRALKKLKVHLEGEEHP